ncbi:hypothetical protein ALC53_07850 [Atta colombica]|uniref:Uncharacterized protein n=1 Tax=Atta colombica TaxID=520822 RepID=A0A195BAX9_9HYME|nr:hypothetical protein ALC53_07850 [Atta colombica]
MIEIYADSVLISKTHERTISRSTKETSIVVHLTLNAIKPTFITFGCWIRPDNLDQSKEDIVCLITMCQT